MSIGRELHTGFVWSITCHVLVFGFLLSASHNIRLAPIEQQIYSVSIEGSKSIGGIDQLPDPKAKDKNLAPPKKVASQSVAEKKEESKAAPVKEEKKEEAKQEEPKKPEPKKEEPKKEQPVEKEPEPGSFVTESKPTAKPTAKIEPTKPVATAKLEPNLQRQLRPGTRLSRSMISWPKLCSGTWVNPQMLEAAALVVRGWAAREWVVEFSDHPSSSAIEPF